MTKTIPKKKKCKKAKWSSEEVLQIAKKRNEVKGKEERERYTQKNRIPENSKERQNSLLTEENNRMGKTRDLFKKIGDITRTFHSRMGTIKDRNGKVLTEVAEIGKRWQGYTEELYKQGLNDLDNYDGVVTHLELDILEGEVRWASGNISTN